MKTISSQNIYKSNITFAILFSFLIHIPFMLFFLTYKPAYQCQNHHPKIIDLIELKSVSAQKSNPSQNATKSHKEENIKLKKQSTETLIPSPIKNKELDTIDEHNLPVNISDLQNSNSDKTDQSDLQSGDQNISETVMHRDTIIDAEEIGIKPQKIFSPAPSYPPIAQDLGISGIVRALLTIDTSGMVKEIKIVNSPHSSLSDEVIRTLKSWKFKPIRYNNQKVIIKQFVQEIEFKE